MEQVGQCCSTVYRPLQSGNSCTTLANLFYLLSTHFTLGWKLSGIATMTKSYQLKMCKHFYHKFMPHAYFNWYLVSGHLSKEITNGASPSSHLPTQSSRQPTISLWSLQVRPRTIDPSSLRVTNSSGSSLTCGGMSAWRLGRAQNS